MPGPQKSTLAEENRAREEPPEIQVTRREAGVDLPLLGHVSYKDVALFGGLATVGAIGLLEWPVAAAIGVAYGLSRR